ncbi:MAG: CYTH domain-containing protein [Rhizobiaceae bacterium]|nr:CYTH domain-containing protein [Rhizobiaceae bacterium]
MAKEIERKFLVASDGWREKARRGKGFRQAIVFSEGNRTVRIRAIDEKKAKLTIKIGINGLSRHEFEYDVPMKDAQELLALANGRTITKTRYDVKHGKHVWEVDVYGGDLADLVVAEVEMKSEKDRPELPDWLGREVTGDPRYSNQALAEGSLPENWRDEIQP